MVHALFRGCRRFAYCSFGHTKAVAGAAADHGNDTHRCRTVSSDSMHFGAPPPKISCISRGVHLLHPPLATFITSNNSSHAHVCCCLRLQQARRKTPPGVFSHPCLCGFTVYFAAVSRAWRRPSFLIRVVLSGIHACAFYLRVYARSAGVFLHVYSRALCLPLFGFHTQSSVDCEWHSCPAVVCWF